MDEENEPKRKTIHEIGENLDDISIDELNLRIILLEEEIVRLKNSIEQKQASHSKAEAIFKF